MSLRDDFNNAPFPADPRALHNEPLGNSGGLDSFHTTQPEDIEPNNMPKIVGAAAVALMVGVAGVALYASTGSHPKAVVAMNPPPVTEAAPAPAPMPAADATTLPAAADTAPAATAPVKEATAPVKKHRTASAESKSADTASKSVASEDANSAAATRMAVDSSQSTVQPQQQQAITPPAPSPSPSDLASNNTQSGVAVPPNAASAADIPAPQQPAPEPSITAPAENVPADQPAGAAQSQGQVNQ